MSQSRVKSKKGLDLQNGGTISPCKFLSSLIKFSLNVLWDCDAFKPFIPTQNKRD